MCVLCMFYVDWELGRRKKIGIFFEKRLVRVGLQETNNFLGLSQNLSSLSFGQTVSRKPCFWTVENFYEEFPILTFWG